MIRTTQIDTKINKFENGQQAIDYFRKTMFHVEILPDVIFLDLSAPIAGGWKFSNDYTFIQSCIKSKIILLIVSSFSVAEDVGKKKQKTSLTSILPKSIVKDKLIEIIESTSSYQSNPVIATDGPQVYFQHNHKK